MSQERSSNNNMDLSAIGDNLPTAANAVGVAPYDSPIPNIVVTSSNAVISTNWSSSRTSHCSGDFFGFGAVASAPGAQNSNFDLGSKKGPSFLFAWSCTLVKLTCSVLTTPVADYELTSPPPPRYEPSGAGIDPELERLLEQDPGLIDVKSKSFNPRVGEGFDGNAAAWYRGVQFTTQPDHFLLWEHG